MKKLIWVSGIVVGVLLVWYLSESPGKKEFKKQLEAMDTVKSWKMDLQVSSNGRMVAQRTHEAQCPDMEHITEYGPESEGEFIRMANLVYYRKNGRPWVQDANTPKDLFMPIVTPRPCMSNPGGTTTSADSGDTEWKSELNRAMKDGSFEKGQMDKVNGEACRNWQVTWMNGRNQLVAYTMCINEQDHLPRRLQMLRENINMYFTWNVPVEVKAPDLTPPVATPAYPASVPPIPNSFNPN